MSQLLPGPRFQGSQGMGPALTHVLETFARYHHEQGLSARKVAPEELFAASTLDLTKI